MTPADELRQAATRLRETATKATPGPWEVASGDTIALGVEQHSPGGYSYDVELAYLTETGDRQEEAQHARNCGRAIEVGRAEDDAAWMALASPVLADPLAAWLEAVATDIEISEADRKAGWAAVISPMHPALAVARTINGTAS